MRWLSKNLKSNLGSARKMATKKVIARFADKHGLVYFGHVDQHEDEHRLVRGATVSAKHIDSHYCVGTIQNYDVIVVYRTDTLEFPNKPAKNYSWLIMQFDLHSGNGQRSHVFLDAHHYDETFYAHLFTKFNRLHKVAPAVFEGHDKLFTEGFDIYAQSDQNWLLEKLLTTDVTATLGHHFRGFDFEITHEHLFVYSSNNLVTPGLLEHMTRGGLWLAGHIDKNDN
jgi:hypothetical protein